MNNKFPIVKLALPLPVDRLFDYRIPLKLKGRIEKGSRVKVLFNNRVHFGFVAGFSSHSKIKKLNPIISLLDNFPLLTDTNLKLAESIKDYYICSLGEAMAAMLPYQLKNTKNIIINNRLQINDSRQNNAKLIYVQDLSKDTTYSYFSQEITRRIKDKKRVIFLVPEIQMIDKIKEKLSLIPDINIATWHGKVSKKNLVNLWNDLALDKVDVIIGTRSLIFAPIKNLDLIIVENEGDYAYKEDQVPYYDALEIVKMRSQLERCDVIFSSTVPSSQTYKSILDKKIIFKNINENRRLPQIQLAKISYKEKMDFNLENEISRALEKKERILIFLNRKGFATFIYCRSCKEMLKCSRCSNNLRFDYSQKKLICPTCNQKTEMTEICPKCNSTYVKYGGMGVEKLESNLKRIFPQAKIVKFDEALNKSLNYDIVIGTKKILNYGDFNPGMSIVWNLDDMLNMGDFNSCEEAYKTLARLSVITKNKTIISTSLNPDFYLLDNLDKLNFEKFYGIEFKTRKELKLPPYYYLALISIRSLNKESAEKWYLRLSSFLEKSGSRKLIVSDPNINLRSRIRGKYYKYIMAKSENIKLLNNTLKKALKEFRSANAIITVNINPE
ncbi:MAG: primosomal protein N' [Candidatus Omnitrophica bacterium]|nr:primosomal protein N' [Candidatus Omnitrophota bacterium]